MQVRKIIFIGLGMSLRARAMSCSGGSSGIGLIGGTMGSTLCTPVSELLSLSGMSGGQMSSGGSMEGGSNQFSLNCTISGNGGASGGGASVNPCGSDMGMGGMSMGGMSGMSMGGASGFLGPGSMICNNISLSGGGMSGMGGMSMGGGSMGNDCYSKMNGLFAGGSGFLNTQKMNEICCVPSSSVFSRFR
ncbi:hypothetical protein NEFER03_2039 [Nematocida sp. LUAm3]|nr:hypothetical protein NEFER03_2039 [Nematocida sp. LUAm3]KAI5174513.1 hypothetical protein NEFER02_0634 [Nematocida sp. LUAm2]KAI5179164.1 hypothetical protein NEFER01_2027 [Nematocida sp. LUAm1]